MRKIPYVPQIEPADEFEKWFKNGFSEEDSLKPEANWCGLCCLRMIALAFDLDPPPLHVMYEEATVLGVYVRQGDRIIGAYHRELARYAEHRFGLRAQVCRGLSRGDIASVIEAEGLLIASVAPCIRDLAGDPPANPSGHLVLVHSIYDEQVGGVKLHNSAGFVSTNTQVNVPTPWPRFLECFSGNGIVISAR